MLPINSLTEANRYLEDVEINVWELEERVGRYHDAQPRMRIPYPVFENTKSIGEALSRLRQLAARHKSALKAISELPERDKEMEKEHWRTEREHQKAFNEIVQGRTAPHL